MLPEVIKHRDSAEIIFGLDYRGQRDYVRLSPRSRFPVQRSARG